MQDTSTEHAHTDTSRLMTARDAQRYLAISPRKLWELTNCGELQCVRIGRSVRYTLDDLETFIQRCRIGRKGGRV